METLLYVPAANDAGYVLRPGPWEVCPVLCEMSLPRMKQTFYENYGDAENGGTWSDTWSVVEGGERGEEAPHMALILAWKGEIVHEGCERALRRLAHVHGLSNTDTNGFGFTLGLSPFSDVHWTLKNANRAGPTLYTGRIPDTPLAAAYALQALLVSTFGGNGVHLRPEDLG